MLSVFYIGNYNQERNDEIFFKKKKNNFFLLSNSIKSFRKNESEFFFTLYKLSGSITRYARARILSRAYLFSTREQTNPRILALSFCRIAHCSCVHTSVIETTCSRDQYSLNSTYIIYRGYEEKRKKKLRCCGQRLLCADSRGLDETRTWRYTHYIYMGINSSRAFEISAVYIATLCTSPKQFRRYEFPGNSAGGCIY